MGGSSSSNVKVKLVQKIVLGSLSLIEAFISILCEVMLLSKESDYFINTKR